MANPRLILRNFHDEATLSTEFDPVAGFSVDNTKDRERSRVWQATDGSDQYLAGFYEDGLPRTADGFGMFRHTCHGGQFEARFYTDDNWTTLASTTGLIDVNNIVVTDGLDMGIDPYGTGTGDPYITEAPFNIWFEPVEHLSFRYYFSSSVSTYGFDAWQAARFILGKRYDLPYNVLYDNAWTVVDQTDRNRSRGASLRTNIGPDWREFNADIKRIPEADRAKWLAIRKYCGTGRDFLFSLFPEDGTSKERDGIVNCAFKATDPLVRFLPAWMSTRIQLEEV